MPDPSLDARRLPPSLWAATAPPPPATPPLPAGEHHAELAIVGGGFTGLAAALHAAGRGADVCVLEAAEPGFGASGRNNGQVIPTLTRADPDILVQAFGPEHGETLVALLRDSADTLFGLVRRHGIACEAVQNGWVQPAHRESRLALSRSRVAQWQRRGAPARLLDRDEVAAMTGSSFWCGGWTNTSGGHVNPLALARGLARAALAAGARVHAQTAVTGLARDGDGWRLATAAGSLRAQRVLLATHGYSGFLAPSPLPGLPGTMVLVRSYQAATQPLPAALRATVLPGNASMSDTQADLHFARLDASGRLVSGAALAMHLGYDGRLRQRIAARLLKLYPQLAALGGITLSHLWHGVFAATPDKLPRFHRYDDGMIGWVGCNGRGVAFGTALGAPLVDALLDGGAAARRLPFEAPRTIPGHRFASLGVRAATLYYRWRDGRD
ncbi:MAG: NAD(P)/FAD-dependent oxidoreductase [Aquabacterium sp.]